MINKPIIYGFLIGIVLGIMGIKFPTWQFWFGIITLNIIVLMVKIQERKNHA